MSRLSPRPQVRPLAVLAVAALLAATACLPVLPHVDTDVLPPPPRADLGRLGVPDSAATDSETVAIQQAWRRDSLAAATVRAACEAASRAPVRPVDAASMRRVGAERRPGAITGCDPLPTDPVAQRDTAVSEDSRLRALADAAGAAGAKAGELLGRLPDPGVGVLVDKVAPHTRPRFSPDTASGADPLADPVGERARDTELQLRWRALDRNVDTLLVRTVWKRLVVGMPAGTALPPRLSVWPLQAAVLTRSDTLIRVATEWVPDARLDATELRCAAGVRRTGLLASETPAVRLVTAFRPTAHGETMIRTTAEVRFRNGCRGSVVLRDRLHAFTADMAMAANRQAALAMRPMLLLNPTR